MAEVVAEGLRKTYGAVEAVRGVSFRIGDGELMAILGPSGCGKSSTLRMIAGLESIDGGNLHFGKRLVNRIPPAQRNVAMAFENYGLYPHWTAYENIAYSLHLRKMTERAIDAKVTAIARAFQLESVLDRKPRELSGGYQQRIGLARALVRDPDVFLLDEPLSHVDAEMRSQLREELKRLHVASTATMILVSHDQLDALSMADTILVMNDGEAQQIGAPMEVFARPANTFTAGFVGEPPMNLLDVEVCVLSGGAEQGSLTLGRNGLQLALPSAALPDGVVVDPKVTVGVRPHALEVAETGRGGGVLIECDVDVVEPLGEVMVVSLTVGDVRLRGVLPIDDRARVPAGSKVTVWAGYGDLHFFDAESGCRLG